jgi:hypothetical protein
VNGRRKVKRDETTMKDIFMTNTQNVFTLNENNGEKEWKTLKVNFHLFHVHYFIFIYFSPKMSMRSIFVDTHTHTPSFE